MEVEMYEGNFARRQSQMPKSTLDETINKSTEKTYIKNILRLVDVYEVLIKPGSADICTHMGRGGISVCI